MLQVSHNNWVLELCSGCIRSICPILVRKIPTGHTRMVGQSGSIHGQVVEYLVLGVGRDQR